ncbi:hypothetical protein [Candidatus Sororendozoicomonas aggregata]|uniref:hypothetical protein n=1 Tax=Candidatus Sororendozoicomonas aggregata TaxID=3073239 RepID=UPI002ED48179
MDIPADADAYISGSYYKIGEMERAFVFVNGGWILSSRNVADIENDIDKKRKAGLKMLEADK